MRIDTGLELLNTQSVTVRGYQVMRPVASMGGGVERRGRGGDRPDKSIFLFEYENLPGKISPPPSSPKKNKFGLTPLNETFTCNWHARNSGTEQHRSFNFCTLH